MAAPRQLLTHEGKELPNEETVKEMNICDGAPLKVSVFQVPVTVNAMDGKKIPIMVDPTDMLSDIKKQLEHESQRDATFPTPLSRQK